MKKYLEILKKCPLFEGIHSEELLAMLDCLGAKQEEFDKKYTIFSEGSPARRLGVLLSGSAQVIRLDYDGNRSILMEIQAGELFGEAFACAEVDELPISVVANEPCKVLLIENRRILQTCHRGCGFHHRLIYNLMKDLATKNLQLHQRSMIHSKRTTREKLLAYLAPMARKAEGAVFTIPFDRQELADYLEVDRSGLSAEISKLRKEGILESRKKEFRLL